MERYESLFAQLKERKEGAFVPFVTLGDPGIEQSLKIINTAFQAEQGAGKGRRHAMLTGTGFGDDFGFTHPLRQ